MSFRKIRHDSFFKRAIAWYSTKLQTHPLSTKAISSGIICGAGDLTCQYIVQHRTYNYSVGEELNKGTENKSALSTPFIFEPDWIRTSRFNFLGFALIAPVVHVSFFAFNQPGT